MKLRRRGSEGAGGGKGDKCSRQRKLHMQRLWGGKGLGVFKIENPKSKTNISQNKGCLFQWNIFSVMKNSKQCLPFCLPPSLPASLCCGLVKGFLVSPLLSLLERRCPVHVGSVDHVGEEPGGSRLGFTDDLPDSVDGPWGCWACPGISWRSWSVISVSLKPRQTGGIATGLRVLISAASVSKLVTASWSACLGGTDNRKALRLSASQSPAFTGSSPDFVVFPETGWNCSLAENEMGFHRAFPKASDSKL